MQQYKIFFFEDYTFWPAEKKLILTYSLDHKITFTEEIIFDFAFDPTFNRIAFGRAIFGVFVMCGISYFKAFLPSRIEFSTKGLSVKQKTFFEKIYLHGLGEFFFVNQINPRGKINFVSDPGFKNTLEPGIKIANIKGSIVPIGGGKDSLTTAEILKSQGKDFETWTVGDYPFFDSMIAQIGKPRLSVKRKIDTRLFDLNAQGAFNGHVPISAILAFLGVASAILRNKKNVILSNEASANEPNTEIHGMQINHQYSKSLEFEKDFQAYVHQFISPDIDYFSFLRPLSELKIAEIFCKNFIEKYARNFSSCNRNFKISNWDFETGSWKSHVKNISWCGECPKCAFVFAIFSPFVKKEKLIEIFGENLFAKTKLQGTFRELLGLEGHKPFECVGEIEEVRTAIRMARESGQWSELATWNIPASNFDWQKLQPHSMSKHFENILKDFPSSCHSRT